MATKGTVGDRERRSVARTLTVRDTRGGGGPIIAVLEQDEGTRKRFTTALRVAGFRVFPVGTLLETHEILTALERIGEQVAAVVLDGSPGAGLAAALQIRGRRSAPRLIALVDQAPEQGRQYALFAAHIVKPCLPAHVVVAIEAVLGRTDEARSDSTPA